MEAVFYSIYIFAALLVSFTAVAILGFGLHWERFFRPYVAPLIPVGILLALGASSIVSERDVSLYGLSGAMIVSSASWLGNWILRLATASIVVASVVVVFSNLLHKKSGRESKGFLFLAFAAYFISCYVISGLLGSEPSFTHNNFYALILFLAAYVLRDQDIDRLVRWTRNGLSIFIFTGLLLALILPKIAVQNGYVGLIPGFNFRYWGIASHANNIGPIAVFFLLLLIWKPYQWRSLNILCLVAALVSLLLSQSKTAWIACFAAFLVLFGYRTINVIRGINAGKKMSFTQLAAVGSPFFLSFFLVVGLALGIEYGGYALTEVDSRISTLTGRNIIWSITLREWRENPLFGYGPSLWGNEFAYREGYLGIASNAHNQFVDVLGSSGLLGLLCLLVYLQLLLKYAWSSAQSTQGFSLAFTIFIFVRCITEAPLKTANIMTTDFLMHFVLFSLLLQFHFRSHPARETSNNSSVRSDLRKTQLSL